MKMDEDSLYLAVATRYIYYLIGPTSQEQWDFFRSGTVRMIIQAIQQ